MQAFKLYSPAFDADPYPVYRRLRDEDPCYWAQDVRMWVLTRYHDVVSALGDWRTYSSSKGNLVDEFPGRAGKTLGTTDPPRHDRVRAIIQKAFMRRNLEYLEEPVRALARGALARVAARASFDFVADFSTIVTTGLLCRMLGLETENEREIRAQALLMIQSDPLTRQKRPEHLAAMEWMKAFADRHIAARSNEPRDDLISALIEAEVDGERLLAEEVQMTVATLIMAGVESQSGFLNMLALNLADHPDVRRRVAAEPVRIADAIEETLRYNANAQRFRRVLMKDTTLHGSEMKAGDFVILCYGAANRDERQFADPDSFDLDRRPRGHLGFGGGVHACIGNAVARLATRVAFEVLLETMPEFERVEPTLEWIPSSNFRTPLKLEIAPA